MSKPVSPGPSETRPPDRAGPTSPEYSTSRDNRRTALLLTLAAGAATAIVHAPVIFCQALCLDDTTFLFNNWVFQEPGWSAARRFLSEVFDSSTIGGYYEPLTLISLLLDVKAGGRIGHLTPFHVTSLALHTANVMLVVVLLYRLFGEPWSAALVGLLFGVHPLTVEPIAWVWERKTPLAAFFGLACLVAYAGYVRRGRWWRLAFSVFLLLLSLMSKPTGVMLAAGLILLDVWPLNRFGRRSLIEKAPFLLLAATAAAVTVISTARNAVVDVPAQESPGQVVPRMGWLLAFYAGKIVWPADLSPIYALPSPLALSNPAVAANLVATLALAGLALIAWRWSRAPAVGALMFFLLILPTLGIVGYSWVAASDKYVYLPLIGVLIPLGGGLAGWVRASPEASIGRRRAAAVLLGGVLVAAPAAWATQKQIGHWRTTETLARHMVRVAPNQPRAFVHLAISMEDPARMTEKIDAYLHALRLDPNDPEAHYNLGLAYEQLGQDDAAERHYRYALECTDKHAEAHNRLGRLLTRRGRAREAIGHFERALALRPGSPLVHSNLANALLNAGDVDGAIEHLQKALAAGGRDRTATLNNLGLAWTRKGAYERAIAVFREALALEPDYARGHANLADALLKDGAADEALRHYHEAVRLEPDNASHRLRLGAALESLGQAEAAAEVYRRLLDANPRQVEAQRRLQALATRAAGRPG